MAGRRKKKRRVHSGLLLVALVVGIVVGVIGVRCYALRQTLADDEKTEAEVAAQLTDEQQRSEDLDEYEKYTKTKKYIEEVAKDKLGLVHDGETVFKNEDSK